MRIRSSNGWRTSLSHEERRTANGGDGGSAYIFHYDGSYWVEQTKLIASDGAAMDYFGSSVSLAGDYALVGDNSRPGSAYIFHYDGSNWVEQTKLLASDGAANDEFGRSVSLSADDAVVGTFGRYPNTGSAYIFHSDGANWVEQSKLLASDGAVEDHFGWSVSLSGDYTLVGAFEDGNLRMFTGSTYVFRGEGSDLGLPRDRSIVDPKGNGGATIT